LRLNLALLFLLSACRSHERPELTHAPADGGATPDAGRDASPGSDASTERASCDPEDAQAELCPGALCDGPPSWHWNGDSCFAIECGACTGSDCARGFPSEAACAAAHATCEASLCRSTGGTWMWWTEECDHYACGVAPPAICVVGRPVCNCGSDRAFDDVLGCVPAHCPKPLPTRQAVCEATGGTWGPICCDTVCGEYCPEPCASDACDCGPGREFLEGGCTHTARCHERRIGETCADDTRCPSGSICCQSCGGPGCFGPRTCRAPVCDDDDCTDLCGNRCDSP
jgi:hypothetical protein